MDSRPLLARAPGLARALERLRHDPRSFCVLAVGACVWLWLSAAGGLVSSNDGSHWALGRALAVHRTVAIDPDHDLTLYVDYARVEGGLRSDRPPGAALLAAPAFAVGATLDDVAWRHTQQTREEWWPVARDNFARTHAARARAVRSLHRLQATSFAIALHTATLGALGLVALFVAARSLGGSAAAAALAVLVLGASGLYGPYATALYAHGTAAVLVTTLVALLLRRRDASVGSGLWVGIVGGFACATDYSLVFVCVPLVALHVPLRRWPAVAAGVCIPALLSAAYHQAAFGAWWHTGYRYHATFPWAASLFETFSGSVADGVAAQWGVRTGGMLRLSPVLLLGFAALRDARFRRVFTAFVPWLVLMAMHRTPEGGAGQDHRYILVVTPVLALGLVWLIGESKRRLGRRGVWAASLVILAGATYGALATWGWVLRHWEH